MKIADQSHKALIIDILSESFDDNPSINYLVQQDRWRKIRIKNLMAYCVEICFIKGEIFLSDNEIGCVLMLHPEKKVPKIKAIRLDGFLALRSIGMRNIRKALHREKLLKTHHPTVPYYYLWYAGVYPGTQGKGVGSRLMEEVLEHCDKQKRPVYLETSVIRNVPWYEKYGFSIYHELNLGYRLFQMIRT